MNAWRSLDSHHTSREASFDDEVAKSKSTQRSELRGLEDDGAPSRQSRRNLPRKHEQTERKDSAKIPPENESERKEASRVVPRNDLPTDSNGLKERVNELGLGRDVDRLS